MIYYVVALSGILLLVLNNLKWMKIKRSISNTKKSKAKSTSSITILIKKYFSNGLITYQPTVKVHLIYYYQYVHW
ncbi:conserved domain protein [Yersinia pestis KIM D27]|nr:conserved domain protein [Yersinia pestis KIM D27]SUP87148.1 type II secretion system protein F domain [Yersinia pseudotuberculosis]